MNKAKLEVYIAPKERTAKLEVASSQPLNIEGNGASIL